MVLANVNKSDMQWDENRSNTGCKGQPTACQVHDGTNLTDSIWQSEVPSLCVFGKPYIRGLNRDVLI